MQKNFATTNIRYIPVREAPKLRTWKVKSVLVERKFQIAIYGFVIAITCALAGILISPVTMFAPPALTILIFAIVRMKSARSKRKKHAPIRRTIVRRPPLVQELKAA